MYHMAAPQIAVSWQHVHPVLVHFTTALLPASMVSDAAGKVFTRASLNQAAFWMVLYAALATPFTAFAGWMWAATIVPGHITGTLATHQYLGFFLGAAYIVLAAWRWRAFRAGGCPRAGYLVAAAAVMALLFYQGYLGGRLTLG
jgi:uncharacterized membrane protein